MQPRGMFIGTPEIYFSKRIDNSRVVKVTDPKRRREMISFGITLSVMFLFAMVYLWQHFSAIEYGYRIEQLKGTRDTIVEIQPGTEPGRSFLERPGADRPVWQNRWVCSVRLTGQWQPWTLLQAIPLRRCWRKSAVIMVVSAQPQE